MDEVRTTRAYLAGFGTAGSLLAGAAVVFVLASAAVSFRGWPQLDNHLSAPALVRASSQSSVDPAGPRRVAAVLAAQRAATGPGASTSGGASARPVTAGVTSTSTATLGGRQVAVNSGPHAVINPVVAAGSSPACTSGCGGGSTGGGSGGSLGGVVQQATGALGGTVAASGASLGSTVNGVASSLASNVNGVSSSLAGTVRQAGQALGSTVTGATGAAGSTLAGAGHAVGALLGGH
jgi:hypothetical protein